MFESCKSINVCKIVNIFQPYNKIRGVHKLEVVFNQIKRVKFKLNKIVFILEKRLSFRLKGEK